MKCEMLIYILSRWRKRKHSPSSSPFAPTQADGNHMTPLPFAERRLCLLTLASQKAGQVREPRGHVGVRGAVHLAADVQGPREVALRRLEVPSRLHLQTRSEECTSTHQNIKTSKKARKKKKKKRGVTCKAARLCDGNGKSGEKGYSTFSGKGINEHARIKRKA